LFVVMVVLLLDAEIRSVSMRLMMLEDGWMDGWDVLDVEEEGREKGRKTAGPNGISLVTPRNALQARVTLA
jgi:hypothetical protein